MLLVGANNWFSKYDYKEKMLQGRREGGMRLASEWRNIFNTDLNTKTERTILNKPIAWEEMATNIAALRANPL